MFASKIGTHLSDTLFGLLAAVQLFMLLGLAWCLGSIVMAGVALTGAPDAISFGLGGLVIAWGFGRVMIWNFKN